MKTNLAILKHIKEHCMDISEAVERFGNDYMIFEKDKHYKNAVSMSLLQIGELSGKLSEDFRISKKSDIPWKELKAMRNLFAHNYGSMDIEKIWDTAINDIPILKDFCERQINQYNLLNQDAIEPQYDDEEDLEM